MCGVWQIRNRGDDVVQVCDATLYDGAQYLHDANLCDGDYKSNRDDGKYYRSDGYDLLHDFGHILQNRDMFENDAKPYPYEAHHTYFLALRELY